MAMEANLILNRLAQSKTSAGSVNARITVGNTNTVCIKNWNEASIEASIIRERFTMCS